MDAKLIESVVAEVLARLEQNGSGSATRRVATSSTPAPNCGCGSRPGVFSDAEEAARAAKSAQEQLRAKGIGGRVAIVELVKSICYDKADEWGKLELEETRIGRLDHKIDKLKGIPGLPGVEWLQPYGLSGDHGITLEEKAPFGTIVGITPVTHSIPTLASNVISMVAAGNTVVFNAHPAGARCAATAVATFNEAIKATVGIENVATIVEEPTLESFNALCASEYTDLICVTGGPGVVRAAMKSGKRAICAGPGNPPVVVDQTADLDRAARSIIFGGGYDNNLLCIGEKQIFVVESVYHAFLEAMKRAGAVYLSPDAVKRLADEAFTTTQDAGGCSHAVLNRALVGADASKLAEVAGLRVPPGTEVLFGECPFDCPFVQEEQMMPYIPVVAARDVHEAIDMAYRSEHGYRHSAIMHSKHLDALTEMGRRMDCTLFVKNGASVAGLGNGGEGYANFSVATTTGEGIVTPETFTRKRRCAMIDSLNIV